jgi:FdhD protein
MTLTWVICGAGRQVGKTHLALRLCEILPNSVYAKQGHGEKHPDKPANFFHTDEELAAFIDHSGRSCDHIVIESNELAREGAGDIVIFIDGIPGRTDFRDDVDLLRSRSHLQITFGASHAAWENVIGSKLNSPELCRAVCEALVAQQCNLNGSLPLRHVAPLRYTAESGSPVRDQCDVVIEQLVTIMVEDVGSFAMMCTPCDVEALAIGFAFSEGLISSIDDVVACSYRPDQQTVGLRLDSPGEGGGGRNLIVTSSCGLCGSRNVDKLLADMRCANTLHLPARILRAAIEAMHQRQSLFARTGGTHAAAIFDARGEIIAFAEDIGRHGALDKAIGKCLMEGSSLDSRGAALSGRISLELVAKAARAGVEIAAAVSAPSSLAIDAAERCNITLCGFVRGERATAYTHPERVS